MDESFAVCNLREFGKDGDLHGFRLIKALIDREEIPQYPRG